MRSPVYDGYLADPFIALFEGEYIAYGSGDPTVAPRGFEALRSDDLRSWTSVGAVFAGTDPQLGDAYWAPEVAFSGGRYWMYYSVGHGIIDHHIRVAVADSPVGPFPKPRITRGFCFLHGNQKASTSRRKPAPGALSHRIPAYCQKKCSR